MKPDPPVTNVFTVTDCEYGAAMSRPRAVPGGPAAHPDKGDDGQRNDIDGEVSKRKSVHRRQIGEHPRDGGRQKTDADRSTKKRFALVRSQVTGRGIGQ